MQGFQEIIALQFKRKQYGQSNLCYCWSCLIHQIDLIVISPGEPLPGVGGAGPDLHLQAAALP